MDDKNKPELDWRVPDVWHKEMDCFADSLLFNILLPHIEAKDGYDFYSDDDTWLPIGEQILSRFKHLFFKYYKGIKAFHACRPKDLKSYYEHGLKGQDKNKIFEQFHEIFDDLPLEVKSKAIERSQNRVNGEKGKVFFGCDDKELIERAGHYLINGSELLLSLSAELTIILKNGVDYRQRLRLIGLPTLFEVCIPLHQIPDPQIKSLLMVMLSSWSRKKVGLSEFGEQNMSFVLQETLHKDNIINHYHPRVVLDPHHRYFPYISKQLTCDFCT